MGYDCTLHLVDPGSFARFNHRMRHEPDGKTELARLRQLVVLESLCSPERGGNALMYAALSFCATETPYLASRNFALELWDRHEEELGALPLELTGDDDDLRSRLAELVRSELPALERFLNPGFTGNWCLGRYVAEDKVPALLDLVESVASRAENTGVTRLLTVLRAAARHGLAYWEATDLALPKPVNEALLEPDATFTAAPPPPAPALPVRPPLKTGAARRSSWQFDEYGTKLHDDAAAAWNSWRNEPASLFIPRFYQSWIIGAFSRAARRIEGSEDPVVRASGLVHLLEQALDFDGRFFKGIHDVPTAQLVDSFFHHLHRACEAMADAPPDEATNDLLLRACWHVFAREQLAGGAGLRDLLLTPAATQRFLDRLCLSADSGGPRNVRRAMFELFEHAGLPEQMEQVMPEATRVRESDLRLRVVAAHRDAGQLDGALTFLERCTDCVGRNVELRKLLLELGRADDAFALERITPEEVDRVARTYGRPAADLARAAADRARDKSPWMRRALEVGDAKELRRLVKRTKCAFDLLALVEEPERRTRPPAAPQKREAPPRDLAIAVLTRTLDVCLMAGAAWDGCPEPPVVIAERAFDALMALATDDDERWKLHERLSKKVAPLTRDDGAPAALHQQIAFVIEDRIAATVCELPPPKKKRASSGRRRVVASRRGSSKN